MFFASDNWAGAAPAIVDAVTREAAAYGNAYGDSAIDRAVEARFNEIFEREVTVFLVGTGSAANGLALASVGRPGGVVFCHRDSHIIEDECGGVEFLAVARLLGVEGRAGKIEPGYAFRGGRPLLRLRAFRPAHGGQHHAADGSGDRLQPGRIRAISGVAKQHALPLHMDGARFANALAHLGVSPAEMTWKAGVDILSFGGTKNGCIGAEALVFFDPAKAKEAPYLRKRAGQLFSKSRFIAAQFDAYFRDGLWLELARHANAMADRLRQGIAATPRAREAWSTEGNEVFAVLLAPTRTACARPARRFTNGRRRTDPAWRSRPTRSWCGSSPPSRRGREDVDAFLAELDT